ncbi:hypothetical protein E6W39_01700 [Kitasatospora acidiphila]|uniref:DUF3558 domain-containing protein n=1 Tax=Kitasatospora acidiphila TaxID=2567942 RepID=A0A540VWP1_9ACTN|nr:hypothetical protein [Kitasatospora acidiphila]TQF01182.1 hypothetical protein E6W39_01700 [Kitasatospora acidiphila]
MVFRRRSAVVGLAVLALAGCGGGGSGPSIPKALQQQLPSACGGYWQPKTVATALGHSPFSHIVGQFDQPARGHGNCMIYITLGSSPGSQSDKPYMSLEVDDEQQADRAAGLLADECNPKQNKGDQTVTGPDASCAVFRADPPITALQGGQLLVMGTAGGLFLQVTIDGVIGPTGGYPTLDSDRAHGFQLLADAIAAAKG